MAGSTPQRSFFPVPLGGIWSEAVTPSRVGAQGLTACSNLTYRRYGAWGKRAGSTVGYHGTVGLNGPAVGGIRWYRAFPTPLTQLVVVANNNIYLGSNPGPTPVASAFQLVSQNPTNPPGFASARDNNYVPPPGLIVTPTDILIITGVTTDTSFATGTLNISGSVPTTGTYPLPLIQVELTLGPATPQTAGYSVLPSDNFASIGNAVVQQINDLVANTGGVIGLAYYTLTFATSGQPSGVNIHIGASVSGTAGNSIQYKLTLTNPDTITVSPSTFTNMTGGGLQTSAPIKYDGQYFTGLSWMISQPFTGCVSWHDHVWYWGDPANPDTLYASDINNPEGFTFMLQFGGYPIGQGDGDPAVQTCVPIGNTLYVFKRNSIYVVSGYNFQSGEYQFQIEPYVVGVGVPAPNCVAVLNNCLVFYDGSRFVRLTPGSFTPENIGQPIPLTSGLVANGNANLMRVAAGNFEVQTNFNDAYTLAGATPTTELMTNVALFACDIGHGVADTVLVYDDDATQFLQGYAWAPWSGWNVGYFVPFGGGLNSGQTALDPTALFWIAGGYGGGPRPFQVFQFGADPSEDNGSAVSWLAQTGWITMQTDALSKDLHRVFLQIEATPNVTMQSSIYMPPNIYQDFATNPTPNQATQPRSLPFPVTQGIADTESYQILVAQLQPSLQYGYSYMIALSNNQPEATFEVVGLTLDYIENPFLP